MLVAHLPAGYLLARGLRRLGARRGLALAVVVGAILPDLDLIWFALVDGWAVHHHTYLTHMPAIWLAVLLAGYALRRRWIAGIGLGGLLHVALDTIAGRIMWLWPVSDRGVTLVEVPATRDHWILSFLVHWTFWVELAICAIAAILFLRGLRRGRLI